MADKPRLWKDRLGHVAIAEFADRVANAHETFDRAGFLEAVESNGCYLLELKQRIDAVAACLKRFLPTSFARAVKILIATAPHVGEFENWILTSYVEQYGLGHFERSVQALKVLTRYGTSEFAVRPFVIRYTDDMLEVFREWVRDPNEHVRRLVAEGSRPRGVWVAHVDRFKKDPRPVIQFLEHLRADPSLYVRKAVANNLNDISKDNPDLFLETVGRWSEDGATATNWIIKRACRTLLRQGDPRILALLGFTPHPQATVAKVTSAKKRLKIGAEAVVSFNVVSTSETKQRLVLDYRVWYGRPNGKDAPRIFKLGEKELVAGATLDLTIRHPFKNISTRRHHPGPHRLEIRANGKCLGDVTVELVG